MLLGVVACCCVLLRVVACCCVFLRAMYEVFASINGGVVPVKDSFAVLR